MYKGLKFKHEVYDIVNNLLMIIINTYELKTIELNKLT